MPGWRERQARPHTFFCIRSSSTALSSSSFSICAIAFCAWAPKRWWKISRLRCATDLSSCLTRVVISLRCTLLVAPLASARRADVRCASLRATLAVK